MVTTMRRALLALGVAGALAPVTLAAQQAPSKPKPKAQDEPDRVPADDIERVEVDRLGPGDGTVRILLRPNRARLGVSVNLQAQDSDSIGALISAVTPGSPAAKAGIRSGDIITRLDGTSLLEPRPDERRTARRDESLPGVRLVELASRLAPNDTISVEFRRGNETRTVELVTGGGREGRVMVRRFGDGDEMPFAFGGPIPDGMELDLRREMERAGLPPRMRVPGPGTFTFRYGGPLADLELAPLNPELGAYFGATEGVLVISAPKGSGLGLKGGDVVLAVDGRKPSSPSQLMRILGTYDRGETVKLEVLRNRKRETLSGRVDGAGATGARGKGDDRDG